MVVESEVLNDFPRFVGILIAEFFAVGAVNLALKMKGDMIIKNLNLKLMIDAPMDEGVLEIHCEVLWSSDGKITKQGIGSKTPPHVGQKDPVEDVLKTNSSMIREAEEN
ncbi:hypothetical protein Tco_0659076 [Tanacetum coccineum]